MNPSVALMILNLSCADPVMSFRDFYRHHFLSEWPGMRFEQQHIVFERVLNAGADYIEYRAIRAETCGARK